MILLLYRELVGANGMSILCTIAMIPTSIIINLEKSILWAGITFIIIDR